jgi:hypothetical protein
VNVLRADRRQRLVAGLVAGVLVGAAVAGALLARPAVFEGESSLIARPVSDILTPASTQFGEVVALGLPALPELAASPSVLGRVVAAVPGAPSADELAGDVDVALVPGAGVARVTVRAGSAELAGALTVAVVQALIATDVLEPAARFEALDDTPRVSDVGPTPASALAIGLAAAIVAGVVAALVAGRMRSRATDVRGIQAALERAGHPPVAVLDGSDRTLGDRISALQRASGRPVRVLAVGPGRAERVVEIRRGLGEHDVPVDGDDADPTAARVPASVVAVLDARATTPDELAAATATLPEKSAVIAVVLD